MAVTGTLGIQAATPSRIVPGLGATLGVGVRWAGPFQPAEANVGPVYAQRLAAGDRIVVPPTVASQMASSDAAWWVFG